MDSRELIMVADRALERGSIVSAQTYLMQSIALTLLEIEKRLSELRSILENAPRRI